MMCREGRAPCRCRRAVDPATTALRSVPASENQPLLPRSAPPLPLAAASTARSIPTGGAASTKQSPTWRDAPCAGWRCASSSSSPHGSSSDRSSCPASTVMTSKPPPPMRYAPGQAFMRPLTCPRYPCPRYPCPRYPTHPLTPPSHLSPPLRPVVRDTVTGGASAGPLPP